MSDKRRRLDRYLSQIDAQEFEELVARLWEEYGWETTVTGESRDRGIDVEAERERPVLQKFLIQAKAYSEKNTVGSDQIRLYATLRQQKQADGVAIMCTSSFTKPAESLASDLNVKTVDRGELIEIILEADIDFEWTTAGDVMRSMPSLAAHRPVRTAVELMQEQDISRVPVTQGTNVVGVLSEEDIVQAGEEVGDDSILSITTTKSLPTVAAEDSIEKVREQLDGRSAILVTDEDGVCGIIIADDLP